MRQHHFLLHYPILISLFFTFAFCNLHSQPSPSRDASSLLAFKSKADLNNTLRFSYPDFCTWQGVRCSQNRVHRLLLQNLNLAGIFPPDSLARLDQLRVLSLLNNSLTGPIPDLSGLINLKSLFLSHNSFTGSFPPSLPSLHRLKILDLSFNNLTGPIPHSLVKLDRLTTLRLDSNRLNGSIPPLNQSSLNLFNISHNSLTGPIPVTPTLRRFTRSSFLFNTGLCGEIVHRECRSAVPFFGTTPATPPSQIIQLTTQRRVKSHNRRTAAIIGFSAGAFVFVAFIICLATRVVKKLRYRKLVMKPTMASDYIAAESAAAVMKMEEERELEEKVKKLQMGKSGSLVFCAGEAQDYTLQQLMRASAELLGKGTIGTTYKAVLDNRLIVCVKRLDALKMAGTSKEAFDQQMEAVGGLRHPNLVALRGYFQAKEERLLIYDYQPNGSLYSLIHGKLS